MKTDLFDFDLPPELIADRPASPRDAARMLGIGAALSDHHVRDLDVLLRPGDVMVFNDTKVLLNTEDEYISALRTLVESESQHAIAEYRILNGMGNLIEVLNIDVKYAAVENDYSEQ